MSTPRPRAILRCPLQLGFFPCRRSPTTATMTVVAKGTFDLVPGQHATLVAPDDQLPLMGDVFFEDDTNASTQYSTDLAPYKPRTDVLVTGTAYPREKRRSARVALRIGPIHKRLVVLGDRNWVDGVGGEVPGEPAAVPPTLLRWELAYGGAGHGPNPIGKGHAKPPPGTPRPMANVEYVDALAKSPSDTPAPAGFGPVDARWTSRMKLAGTYDRQWLRERWPWYPDDFDWGYFNAAPVDQQVDGYLKGDEAFALEGLHPTEERIDAKLPALRPRCFAKRFDGGRVAEEVPLALDTVFIDADNGKLVLVWRGAVRIASMKSRELEAVMLAAEPQSEAPLPVDHYAGDDWWVDPEPPVEELAEEEERRAREEQTPADTALDEAQALADARKLLESAKASPELIERLSKVSSVDAFLSIVDEEMAKVPAKDFDDTAARKEGEKILRDQGVDPESLDPKPAEPPEVTPDPGRPTTREEFLTRAKAGESFAKKDLSKLDLSMLDLTGVDFEGTNLSGADLSGSRLDSANLCEAILQNAKLTAASLVEATLEGADLEGADLGRAVAHYAVAARAKAVRANLREAALELADFTGADLTGADMSFAKLADSQWEKARLTGAKLASVAAPRASFREADLTDTDFGEALLDGANLSQAVLDRARFERASLREALFDAARGDKIVMSDADLTEARANGVTFVEATFERAKANRSQWNAAKLDGACFREATLVRADFSGASLEVATFHRAIAKQSSFAEAKLVGAKLTKVDLFQSRLPEADLSGADCRGSNFFGCELTGTKRERTLFDRSNVKRTLLEAVAPAPGTDRAGPA